MTRRPPRRLAIAMALLALAGLAALGYPHLRRYRQWAAIQSARDARDLPVALERIEDLLQVNPDDADAHLAAAEVARRLDDFPAADRHLERYLQLGGLKDAAVLERTMRQSQSGNLSGAEGALRFCLDHPENPSVPLVIEALARGYLAAGQPRRAVEVADAWLKRNPGAAERAYALYLRALAQERQGNVPAAIDGYRESLAAKPDADECRLALAEILTRESPAEARPIYESLVAAGFRPARVRLGLAGCLRQLGELERAAELIEGLKRESPESAPVLVEAARIELDRGRPAAAEPQLARALELAPRHRDAIVQLSRCLRDLGRDAEASARLDELRKLDDELFQKLQPGGPKP